ncbi:MAG: TrbI/VirB10 family protein [Alphaproteobacteria bacterium]|nr:TrbI/VirB10 family protein [Alphaproteobacteria bacterium]
MQEQRASSSEQYIKKTNRNMILIGVGVLLLLLLVLFLLPEKQAEIEPDTPIIGTNELGPLSDAPTAGMGIGTLVVTPAQIAMEKVVLGSKAEAIVTLTAKDGDILVLGAELAEKQEDGFEFETTCPLDGAILSGQTCLMKIHWTPAALRQLQNMLVIRWHERDVAAVKDEKTIIQLKGQSTDSKDCVICENVAAAKKPRVVMRLDGALYDAEDDTSVIIDGQKYKITENNVVVDENKKIIAVAVPKRIPVGLDGKVLGNVSDAGEVISDVGEKLGRALDDGTIVDASLKVLGAALPIVSVMDETGRVIGKMKSDGTIVDETGGVIGRPLADGSVVGLNGVALGVLSPWGLAIDLNGALMGGVLPDGSVRNIKGQTLGAVRPNGFIVSTQGEFLGGVIPAGVGVASGCQSVGVVALNGEVRNTFNQLVGRVLLDGSVVSENGKDIGVAVRQGLVVSDKAVVGFVNSEGKAVDAKGHVIGCVNPDEAVVADKKAVGAVLARGRVVGQKCSVLGSVYPDAQARNPAGEIVGRVLPDKYVADKGKIIGAVVPRGGAIADGCRFLGLIALNGQVIDAFGARVGCVTPEKTIVDDKGGVIGGVSIRGLAFDNAGKVLGRVRMDGKVIDASGKIIGCVDPDGNVTDLKGNPIGRVGQQTPGGFQTPIGDVFARTNEAGVIEEVIIPDGVVVSNDGLILGRYSSANGYALDAKGERFASVLPDLTAVAGDKTKIVGALIPDQSTFMDDSGKYLGMMQVDGRLVDAQGAVIGAIRADGTLIDKDNKIIGYKIPRGNVFSAAGQMVGFVDARGAVSGPDKTKVGRVLANGLAVSDNNQILGGVFPAIGVPIGPDGVLGGMTPYGEVKDASGRKVGAFTPFGLIWANDGKAIGRLVKIGAVVNAKGNLVAQHTLKGLVLNADDVPVGRLTTSGTAFTKDGVLLGRVVPRAPVVDAAGRFVSYTAPDARVMTDNKPAGIVGVSGYVFTEQNGIAGRMLPPGAAVDALGMFLGWTQSDGRIGAGASSAGFVGLDNRVVDAGGEIIGFYAPLGAAAFNDAGQTIGAVGTDGSVMSFKNARAGLVAAGNLVVSDGQIVGRMTDDAVLANDYAQGQTLAEMNGAGELFMDGTTRLYGSAMTNGLALNQVKKAMGAVVPTGLAVASNLAILGESSLNGVVLAADKAIGDVLGNGAVLNAQGMILGGILPPATFVNRSGEVAARSAGKTEIVGKSGVKLGSHMPFGSLLTVDNTWGGHALRTGMAVDDFGAPVGIAAANGLVLSKAGTLVGRLLPDGGVAGVAARETFSPMPYIGRLAQQGLPVGYKGNVLGRTTMNGDVWDEADKAVARVLDDGTLLAGGDMAGAVVRFGTAVSWAGQYLGSVNGDGQVLSAEGRPMGSAATNDAIKESQLKIVGQVAPENLVVNDCKVLGQPNWTAQVINAAGDTVGRVQNSGWAVDSYGNRVGRLVRQGPVMSPTGEYLGRVLSDSRIADAAGTDVGCVRNDGVAVDNLGKVLGALVERGPVISRAGAIVGRVTKDGAVIGRTGTPVGRALGDGKATAADMEGKLLGRIVPRDEELIYDSVGGALSGTLSRGGEFRNLAGEVIFMVNENGEPMDPLGNKLCYSGGDVTLMRGMQGETLGIISDCAVLNATTCEKIATIQSDGRIIDLNNAVYAVVAGTKLISDKGKDLGDIVGTSVSLEKCGVRPGSRAPEDTPSLPGRKIRLGDGKLYDVVGQSIVDPETGEIKGYIGPDGQPKDLDEALMKKVPQTPIATPSQPPVVPPIPEATPAEKQISNALLGAKRDAMKRNKDFSRIQPGAAILAKIRKRKQKDWGKPVARIVSTWPVDMSRVVLKDKAIPAVLAHSIDSRFTNVPASAIVERNVYSEHGRNIIIPAGSRLIGTAQEGAGQDKVAKLQITWQRLIRPDGAAFIFEATSGDAQGRGGIAAYLDEELVKKYGLPLLSTTVTSAISYMMATNQDLQTTESGTVVQSARSQAAADARQNFIDSMGKIFQQLLDEAKIIPPVVYVPSGTRMTVYANEDLWLRNDYEDEREFLESQGGGTGGGGGGGDGGDGVVGSDAAIFNGEEDGIADAEGGAGTEGGTGTEAGAGGGTPAGTGSGTKPGTQEGSKATETAGSFVGGQTQGDIANKLEDALPSPKGAGAVASYDPSVDMKNLEGRIAEPIF